MEEEISETRRDPSVESERKLKKEEKDHSRTVTHIRKKVRSDER